MKFLLVLTITISGVWHDANAAAFSDEFCMVEGKACKGHNMYTEPLYIGPTYAACVKKCLEIESCAGVNFYIKDAQPTCEIKSQMCPDDKLADESNTQNFRRLPEGVIECDGKRVLCPDGKCEVKPACNDVVGASHTLPSGEVYALQGCKSYMWPTKEVGQKHCEASGGTLATLAQLTEAMKAGYSRCGCGWLADTDTAKFPMSHTKAGCGSKGMNNCAASDIGNWGGAGLGWNAFCFKAKVCDDVSGVIQPILRGQVYALEGCKSYMWPTKEVGQEHCSASGGKLATLAQLTEAMKAGYSRCGCGWLADTDTAKFPMSHTKAGCGKKGMNDCPTDQIGNWGGAGLGWNAFCFESVCDDQVGIIQPIKGGEVYAVQGCESYMWPTKEDGQKHCSAFGDTLATLAQLTEAMNAGYSRCGCGWLADTDTAKFPMTYAKAGCGSKGMNNCAASDIGHWGGAGLGWNAFCFKAK